jgi:hypothetical protein
VLLLQQLLRLNQRLQPSHLACQPLHRQHPAHLLLLLLLLGLLLLLR